MTKIGSVLFATRSRAVPAIVRVIALFTVTALHPVSVLVRRITAETIASTAVSLFIMYTRMLDLN